MGPVRHRPPDTFSAPNDRTDGYQRGIDPDHPVQGHPVRHGWHAGGFHRLRGARLAGMGHPPRGRRRRADGRGPRPAEPGCAAPGGAPPGCRGRGGGADRGGGALPRGHRGRRRGGAAAERAACQPLGDRHVRLAAPGGDPPGLRPPAAAAGAGHRHDSPAASRTPTVTWRPPPGWAPNRPSAWSSRTPMRASRPAGPRG